jgi:hypothetical protein
MQQQNTHWTGNPQGTQKGGEQKKRTTERRLQKAGKSWRCERNSLGQNPMEELQEVPMFHTGTKGQNKKRKNKG